MSRGLERLAPAVLGVMLSLCAVSARADTAPSALYSARAQFKYASLLFEQRHYAMAAREFQRVIERFPASSYVEGAQFGLAECYMGRGRYREAASEYKLFIRNFPDSPLVEEALRRYVAALDNDKYKGRHAEPAVSTPTGPRGGSALDSKVEALRAVQVMLFDGRSLGEIDAELERLGSSGVNTIIVRVFHNRGDRFHLRAAGNGPSGVYFRTSHAPVVADVLGPILSMAHARGLKVFAWMTTRYADYGLEGRKDLACRAYDIGRGAVTACKGLDLFNDEAVAHLEALYADLAAYDIDGILFQDDLVLRHNEGFGKHAERLFRRETGKTLDPKRLFVGYRDSSPAYGGEFWEWASWKNARLLAVARRLMDTVRERNPGVSFAVNLMYESVTNPPYALAWLSQNLPAAIEAGFDYFSIMAYQRQMEKELGLAPEEVEGLIKWMVEEASRLVGEPRRVLIKLQTIDWKTREPLPEHRVVELIRWIKARKKVSIAVVPYRAGFPFGELGAPAGMALLEPPTTGRSKPPR
ncbi:MAG TPA: tetratricopeptide repeat protein [Deltaproteobacteria bacterium]|nr:tetratricopeptide repeat protein [Deltaproteobacteria bacterium]